VPGTVEGKNLAPLMHDRDANLRDEIFGAYGDVQRMVRTGRWKLIYYPKIDRTQLFDLQNDPLETRDLAAQSRHARTVAGLRNRLTQLQDYHDDPLRAPARPSSP